jgi:hypothetical protein
MTCERHVRVGVLLALLIGVLTSGTVTFGAESLESIRDSFDARQREILSAVVEAPFPSKLCASPPAAEGRCTLGKLAYGINALALNSENLSDANREIESAIELIPLTPGYRDRARPDGTKVPGSFDFHFVTSSIVYHIVRLFGRNGRFPGRLKEEAERKAKWLFWDFVSHECKLADARANEPWLIRGSENHWEMFVETCWSGAELLRDDDDYKSRRYKDGSDANDQYAAWTTYLIASTRARLRHGLFIEYFSTGYLVHSLAPYYTYFDFADDSPELRRLSKALLDVWWTAWAQEQIRGVHGGSKTRVYWNHAFVRDPVEGLPWLYLKIGKITPAVKRPSIIPMTMSRYRLPLVTMDIALNVSSRGRYEVRTCQLGIQKERRHNLWINIDNSIGAVSRVTYVTPTFVMGSATANLVPGRRADAISEQNRWNGLVLNGNRTARIFATTYRPNKKAYNDVYVMQSGATQVVTKLDPPWSKGAGPLRVWFGATAKLRERSGWVFVEDGAYVAVRPILGSYKWDSGNRQWMIPDRKESPVIIQAAELSEFSSFNEFQEKVIGQRFQTIGNRIVVPTLDGRSIRFPLSFVNSLPPFQCPKAPIESPFVIWDGKQDAFRIKKDGRELVVRVHG